MSENLSPITPEASDAEDDTDSSKSKSKKKALGTFLVEAEPPKKKVPSPLFGVDKPESSFFGKRRETATEAPADSKNETLSETEKVAATQQLAAARRAEVAVEAAESPAASVETEIVAAAAFLAAAETLGDAKAAYEQIATELAAQLETDDEIDTSKPHAGEIELHTTDLEAESTDEADNDPQNSTSRGATSQPASAAPSPAPGGTGGSGSNTPPPPRGPSGPQYGPAGPSAAGGGGPTSLGAGPTFNAAPTAPAEASVSLDAAYAAERQALTNGLIVGGVVGYLFGRRRGRIKTEKRLAPVQRKLEKQVKFLQSELLQTENSVRQQVRKLQQEQPQAAQQLKERLQRSVSSEAVKRPEQILAPVIVPPERIGHVLVAASARGGVERLRPVTKLKKQEILSAKKTAETLSRSELLALSEKVQVDGTSLRQIYETQLVSEKGLRRLVAEHLRGGNVSRALRKELVQRDIDFERDPILRDRGSGDDSVNVSSAGKTALSGLLAQAGMSDQPQAEPIGPSTKILDPKNKPKNTKWRQQQLIDGGLITLITILVLVIIAVLMHTR